MLRSFFHNYQTAQMSLIIVTIQCTNKAAHLEICTAHTIGEIQLCWEKMIISYYCILSLENVEYFNYLGSMRNIDMKQDVHVKLNPGLPW